MSWLVPTALACLAAWAGVRLLRVPYAADRAHALHALANRHGWVFDHVDRRRLPQRWGARFLLFDRGMWRRAANVISGELRGFRFFAFDYHFLQDKHSHRWSVIAVGLPAVMPMLDIRLESRASLAADAAGLTDIHFESEDFNRTFRVTGDARFAHDVLTPRTMESLMRSRCADWLIDGDLLLATVDGLDSPDDVERRLHQLVDLLASVRDSVWTSHGRSGATVLG